MPDSEHDPQMKGIAIVGSPKAEEADRQAEAEINAGRYYTLTDADLASDETLKDALRELLQLNRNLPASELK